MTKSNYFVFFVVLFIELTVILLLMPKNITERMILEEYRMLESHLGKDSRTWIEEKAGEWYRTTILDTGFYEGMYQTLIPTEEEKAESKGMESLGSWWFPMVEGRIEAFTNMIYQFYMRAALILTWLPYVIILLLPAVYDGVMTWKIKRTNFSYASPVLHRYSVRGFVWTLAVLFLLIIAPIAISPAVIPVALMICSVLVGLAIGNWQKRI